MTAERLILHPILFKQNWGKNEWQEKDNNKPNNPMTKNGWMRNAAPRPTSPQPAFRMEKNSKIKKKKLGSVLYLLYISDTIEELSLSILLFLPLVLFTNLASLELQKALDDITKRLKTGKSRVVLPSIFKIHLFWKEKLKHEVTHAPSPLGISNGVVFPILLFPSAATGSIIFRAGVVLSIMTIRLFICWTMRMLPYIP